MRKFAALLVLSAAVALSACVYDGYGGAQTPYYYDGYYDGFYGMPRGGYWGSDGFFYFLLEASRRYHRDDGRHFRREPADGFHPFHVRDPYDHERRERQPPPPRPRPQP